MSEQQPTPEEIAQAAALAQALEGTPSADAGADALAQGEFGDALQGAALLRYVSGEDALDPQQAERILQGLQELVVPDAPQPPASSRRAALSRWARAAPIAGGLAAAAAVALMVTLTGDGAESFKVTAVSAPASAPAPAVYEVAEAPRATEPAAQGAGSPQQAAADEVLPAAPPSLPSPDAALLAAQASVPKGPDALAAYEEALRPYRRRVLSRLRNTYPVSFGMLSAPRRQAP